MLIRPFSGSIVRPELAHRTVTPAHDLLAPGSRDSAPEDPLSYHHVVTCDESGPDVPSLAERAATLRRMLADEVFVATGGPTLVVHRITVGARSYTGLVVEIAVTEHAAGRVAGHEGVHERRVDAFAAHLRTVGATSTPALVIHPPRADLSTAVASLTTAPPYLEVQSPDGRHHTLWRSDAADEIGPVAELLSGLPRVYVADGHHRIEAAARMAAEGPSPVTNGGRGWFLAHLVSPEEVELLPYHRLVVDVADEDHDAVVARLRQRVPVDALAGAQRPRSRGEVVMCLGGSWYRLRLDQTASAGAALSGLDAELVQRLILAPVFGVHDPTTDRRLRFIPDQPRLAAFEQRCHEEAAVGLVLHPPAVSDVFAVADAGQMMPPKSTWFRPKLPSGLVLHLLAGSTGEDRGQRMPTGLG